MLIKHIRIIFLVLLKNKWVKSWSEGIVDWTFTKEEILEEFTNKSIIIPEPLMIEWDNLILKLKIIRNDNYMKNK